MTKKLSKIHQRINMTAAQRNVTDKLQKQLKKTKNDSTPDNLTDLLKQLSDLNVDMPQNDFWDLANKHYDLSKEAMQNVEGALVSKLQSIVADEAAFNNLQDAPQLLSNIKVLVKDIESHAKRLDGIHDQHKDKTGGTMNPDEHIQVININQQYADALEIYEANIVPNTAHILEQIGTIEDALEEFKKSQITDVSVVTDVEVKEPTQAE